MDFRGCSAVITGGSRGLGLLVARELGRQGARITVAARDEAELERARQDLEDRGIDVTTVVCDIANQDEAQRLVDGVVARTGRIDVLVNNAGVIKVGPLEHMQRTDFEEAMAVHFWGPLQTMTAAIPAMRRQRAGRIVNVSSIGGKIGVPHLAPYCASKFALAGLSDSVRGEIAQGRDPRDHGLPGDDAHRLAVQRVVQGPPSRGVHLVRDLGFAVRSRRSTPGARRCRSSTRAATAMRSW